MQAQARGLVTLALWLVACADDPLSTDDVGDADYCEPVSQWPADAAEAELGLVAAINEHRRVGATCGETFMAPQLPLELVPELRCAARHHAATVARTGSLSHESPDGTTTLERVGEAGYAGLLRHELVAGDFLQAQAVADAFMASEEHCRSLLDPDLTDVGTGARRDGEDGRIGWVVLTGEPRPAAGSTLPR